MSVHQKFKKIRSELGYKSQQDFADVLGVERATISDIERGKTNPRFHLLEKIRTICKVNLNYLVDDTESIYDTGTTLQEPESKYHTSSHVGQALEKCEKEKERLWDQVEWLRAELDKYKKKDTG